MDINNIITYHNLILCRYVYIITIAYNIKNYVTQSNLKAKSDDIIELILLFDRHGVNSTINL